MTGKGKAPEKGRDFEAYRKGFDRIARQAKRNNLKAGMIKQTRDQK